MVELLVDDLVTQAAGGHDAHPALRAPRLDGAAQRPAQRVAPGGGCLIRQVAAEHEGNHRHAALGQEALVEEREGLVQRHPFPHLVGGGDVEAVLDQRLDQVVRQVRLPGEQLDLRRRALARRRLEAGRRVAGPTALAHRQLGAPEYPEHRLVVLRPGAVRVADDDDRVELRRTKPVVEVGEAGLVGLVPRRLPFERDLLVQPRRGIAEQRCEVVAGIAGVPFAQALPHLGRRLDRGPVGAADPQDEVCHVKFLSMRLCDPLGRLGCRGGRLERRSGV